MIDLSKITGFEWNKGNIDKSYRKHGITPNESEEIFLDESIAIERDIRHEEVEDRYIGIGKTLHGKLLFIVFTLRNNALRVISARRANKKERRLYEKAKENS